MQLGLIHRSFVPPTERHYETGDVHSFHVSPDSGDVFLYFDESNGVPSSARIFFDEWESMVRTVKEEHDAREERSNNRRNNERRNNIYGRGNNADNDE